MQIRTVENGTPTQTRLPFASKVLSASEVSASSNASVPTKFTFDTPVFLESPKQYAIVLIPVGGNPDYNVWIGELGQTDVLSASPIYTNNETGTLYLSSNDTQWTAIQNEDIKFNLYVANFTATTGSAVFKPRKADFIDYTNLNGIFYQGEIVYCSNNYYNLAKLNISGASGFSPGEIVYQSNGSSNTASGIVFNANTTSVLVTNTSGAFVTTNNLIGATSSISANVSSVVQNVSVSSGNTVSVPFSNIFSNGMMLFVGTNNRSNVQISVVTSIINSSAIGLSSNLTITDTNCLLGRIRGDGALYGNYNGRAGTSTNPKRISATLENVTSTSSLSFSTPNNYGFDTLLIGKDSQASATISVVWDRKYDAIVPQFTYSSPQQTDFTMGFAGFDSGTSKAQDAGYINVTPNIEKELHDRERVIMSRSNELSNLTGGRAGQSSLKVQASFSTANNKISPFIDTIKNFATLTYNVVVPEKNTGGYMLNIPYANNKFALGTIIHQANSSNSIVATGTIFTGNNSFYLVTDVTGTFTSNSSVFADGNTSINAIAVTAQHYSENININYTQGSRYISKNVILKEGFDSENILVYLTAYRPSSTDFMVFVKIQNANDNDKFDDKSWSRLVEISSPNLLSSTVNINDFVELQYVFPTSQQLLTGGVSCNTTSQFVTVSSTAGISNGQYIYLSDNTTTGFNVRKVINIANNTSLQIYNPTSFTSANTRLGVIPDLKISTGAFAYANNNGIVRYVSNNDVVYDGYKIYAIKIVPVADTTYIIPRAADYRAIAGLV